MDKNYTKLFHRILSSSIWDEDDQTRLLWITMLASTDENGLVIATASKLARDARIPLDACLRGLDKFLGPDKVSLTTANEGRRIEAVEGGWKLLNHQKYKDMMNQAAKREYFRQKRREYRAKERDLVRGASIRETIKNKVDGQMAVESIQRNGGSK